MATDFRNMFEKHCQICGVNVPKDSKIKRFGKFFCSDDHAQQYLQRRDEEMKRLAEEEKRHPRRRGGCC